MKALLDAQKKELDTSLAKCKELTDHVVSLTAQVATLQANDVVHVKKEIVRDLPGSKGKQVASQGSEADATAPTASGAAGWSSARLAAARLAAEIASSGGHHAVFERTTTQIEDLNIDLNIYKEENQDLKEQIVELKNKRTVMCVCCSGRVRRRSAGVAGPASGSAVKTESTERVAKRSRSSGAAGGAAGGAAEGVADKGF